MVMIELSFIVIVVVAKGYANYWVRLWITTVFLMEHYILWNKSFDISCIHNMFWHENTLKIIIYKAFKLDVKQELCDFLHLQTIGL